MSTDDDLRQLLIEIRDNQRESLRRQDEQLEIAKEQLARAKTQIEESIRLQREAIARARSVARIALPGIVFCIVAILYLVVQYS